MMGIVIQNMKADTTFIFFHKDILFPLSWLNGVIPTYQSIAFTCLCRLFSNSLFQSLMKLLKGIQNQAKLETFIVILPNSARPIQNVV